jgi:hypothetical protein
MAAPPKAPLRVLCISDLHLECTENRELLPALLNSADHSQVLPGLGVRGGGGRRALACLAVSSTRLTLPVAQDVLLVAGNVACYLETVKGSLLLLKAHFHTVFYVPGSLEATVSSRDKAEGIQTSFDKVDVLLAWCRENNIGVDPQARLHQAQNKRMSLSA